VNAPAGTFPPADFLARHWQREPCVIRGAWPDFEPDLDGDDLAGLACEPLAEARIVSGRHPDGNWRVRYGPFDEDEFDGLPPRDWTLLVQDCEKHYPPLARWMRRFAFLPSWRLDDLMISFAAPGGSVGPHVDQYDVFLLQATGRRRWQIARNFDPAEIPGLDLKVLARFEPEDEWELGPGDMLYLPPGVAHHGVAVDACTTWSFGFRAPSAADLLVAVGEALADRGDQGGRYRDPDPLPASAPGEIDGAALAGLRRLLHGAVDGEGSNALLGAFVSTFRMAHAPAPPDGALDAQTVATALAAGATVAPNPWTRLCWVREGERARLFASGDAHECSPALAAWACTLPAPLPADLAGEDATALVAELHAGGHLFFEDADPA